MSKPAEKEQESVAGSEEILNKYTKQKPNVSEVYARVPTLLREAIEAVRVEKGLSVYKTVEVSFMMFLEKIAPEIAEEVRKELYKK